MIEFENKVKELKTLIKDKTLRLEIENLSSENFNIFIEKIISNNNAKIDLEIFSFTKGKFNNISEYNEEYKNQELKPISPKHYELLWENNILQKIKISK